MDFVLVLDLVLVENPRFLKFTINRVLSSVLNVFRKSTKTPPVINLLSRLNKINEKPYLAG